MAGVLRGEYDQAGSIRVKHVKAARAPHFARMGGGVLMTRLAAKKAAMLAGSGGMAIPFVCVKNAWYGKARPAP